MFRMIGLLGFLLILTISWGVPLAWASLTDGLIAYYPFNGDANDESGNGNHGTVHGATLTEDRFGNPDSAYSFDGVDDYIDIPYSSTLEPSIFTISLWIKTTMTTQGSIISSDGADAINCHHGYNLRIENGKVRFSIDPSANCGDGERIWSNDFVDDGEWRHIVAIYDEASSLRLYVDTRLQDDTKTSDYSKTGASVRIGMYRGSEDIYFFFGAIDDIRIYDRILSEDEIKMLYSYSAINGKVTDALTGEPIEQAIIIAIKKPNRFWTPTNNNGYYEILNLPPAIYWLLCIKKGYKASVAKVLVQRGKVTSCDFVLRRK